METDCSQMHQPCNSILAEIQVSLCDESMKRSADPLGEMAYNKSKKKRRSSLSSHRRSITGSIVPAFHIETEPGSQGSSENSSQKTSSDDNSQPALSTNTNESSSRLPNPVNLQLDAIIAKMRSQISALDEEYKKWGDLLAASKVQEEETKQMALNLLLNVNDIPADVRELAMSKYVTSKPVDVTSVKKRLDGLLLQYKFDKEACLQDLQLIHETVETVRSTNEFLNSRFSQLAQEAVDDSKVGTGTGEGTADPRQTIQDYHDCA